MVHINFNIRYLNSFNNFLLLSPLFLVLTCSWIFFLKSNFSSVRLNPSVNDKLNNSHFLKKHNGKVFICFSLIVFMFLLVHFFFVNGSIGLTWLNHNYLNNFNLGIITMVLMVLCVSYCIFKNTKHQNLTINNDYYFSLLNVSVFILCVFLCNSLFSFLFVLEVISISIFYKFAVSKFWFNDKFSFFKKTNVLERVFSRNYVNVLFFQYWVNFFSSVVMIITVINVMYMYGSTDWSFINLLNLINSNNFSYSDVEFNVIVWVFFFTGFFLKVGLTPSHLFKVEVYKGIPFISIFFYTTFYFLGYFIFLTVIVQTYINSFKFFFYFFFVMFLMVGFVYTIFLLFDVSFTKAFFAYSTVVNTLAFMSVLITNI